MAGGSRPACRPRSLSLFVCLMASWLGANHESQRTPWVACEDDQREEHQKICGQGEDLRTQNWTRHAIGNSVAATKLRAPPDCRGRCRTRLRNGQWCGRCGRPSTNRTISPQARQEATWSRSSQSSRLRPVAIRENTGDLFFTRAADEGHARPPSTVPASVSRRAILRRARKRSRRMLAEASPVIWAIS